MARKCVGFIEVKMKVTWRQRCNHIKWTHLGCNLRKVIEGGRPDKAAACVFYNRKDGSSVCDG